MDRKIAIIYFIDQKKNRIVIIKWNIKTVVST